MAEQEVHYIPISTRTRKMLATVNFVFGIASLIISTFFVCVYLFSIFFWSHYNSNNTNVWLSLLGEYQQVTSAGSTQLKPVGGLAYYAKAPCILGIALGFVAVVCVVIATSQKEQSGVVDIGLQASFPMRIVVGLVSGLVGMLLSGWLLIMLF